MFKLDKMNPLVRVKYQKVVSKQQCLIHFYTYLIKLCCRELFAVWHMISSIHYKKIWLRLHTGMMRTS